MVRRLKTVPNEFRLDDPGGGGVVGSVTGGTPTGWPEVLASSAMMKSMCSTMEEKGGRCFGS